MSEPIVSLAAAVISLMVGVLSNLLAGSDALPKVRKFLGLPEKKEPETYGERLKELTDNLQKASAGVDDILHELGKVSSERELAITRLEQRLSTLSAKEKELQTRIDSLENTPIPVAEYFASLTDKGERRSARRDYLLFGAGVLVSTVIAIILGMLGL
jgi:DNA repair ATPase RecN